jgi:hypothetical protein
MFSNERGRYPMFTAQILHPSLTSFPARDRLDIEMQAAKR